MTFQSSKNRSKFAHAHMGFQIKSRLQILLEGVYIHMISYLNHNPPIIAIISYKVTSELFTLLSDL